MKLEIGDKLFKNGFMCYLEYRIDGIRVYKDNTVFEATCLSCTHGSKCRVLLCQAGNKNCLEFAGMIDEDGDESYQHYSHNMEGHYYRTLEGAKKARLQTLVREKGERVEQLKKDLAAEEKRWFELKDALSLVKDAK